MKKRFLATASATAIQEIMSLVADVIAKFQKMIIQKNKVTSLEIIVRMIDNKPYYEIKYKKVGEDYYHVGYSSFNIDNVLKWRDECFELVDVKVTNADRIRNMSDEEMAERIASSPNFNCADYCDSFTQGCTFNCGKKGREIALKWLQSEAE